MKALEDSVRSVEMEGLVWGASKLVPIGYGIRKLQITLVVGSSVARLRHAPFDLMNNVKRMNLCRLMISKRRLPNLKIMFRALT
jgi:translation elongation factor EF-1beta